MNAALHIIEATRADYVAGRTSHEDAVAAIQDVGFGLNATTANLLLNSGTLTDQYRATGGAM